MIFTAHADDERQVLPPEGDEARVGIEQELNLISSCVFSSVRNCVCSVVQTSLTNVCPKTKTSMRGRQKLPL